MPVITDSIWRDLTGAAADGSVHLADWPDAQSLPADPDLVAAMDRVREISSAAHSVRKANGRRARLPLAALTVVVPDSVAKSLAPFADLIADEVNVRQVRFTADTDRYATRSLAVNFKVAAPRLGPATQTVAAAARRGEWEALDAGRVRVGEEILEPGEWELRVQPVDESTTRTLPGDRGLVVLDLDVTEELVIEGRARDLVRAVQQRRRELGLAVTDRIRLEVAGRAELAAAVGGHRAWIAEQVLAVAIDVTAEAEGDGWASVRLADGTDIATRITRAAA
jgi:isoleucyl-tRNA synthetase